MFPPNEPWKPQLDWNAPAGCLLKRFISCLPPDGVFDITVFGSAPLQLGIDSNFVSGDVDIFSSQDFKPIIQKAGLSKDTTAFYIEQTDERVFIAGPSWQKRAFECRIDNANLTFPHPIDILVGKIKRIADKDLLAYKLVLEKTGHPTPDELKTALQGVVDVYRPPFDEEDPSIGNATFNTEKLWRELYGLTIDVRAEIIRPALAVRRQAYGLDAPDFKAELRRIGEGS